MDENGVRALLSQVADTEPPPAGIDLGAAITAGRRGRRWRRLRAGGTVALAAGAAVAVIVALLTGPAQRPDHQTVSGTVAPSRFSLLVPYASFGWLPSGFRTGAVGGTTPRTMSEQVLLIAKSRSGFIEAQVYPRGACHRTTRVLACSAFNTTQPVRSRAPDVGGHPAYWLVGATLAWQYAPGGWTVLNWTNAQLPWPPTGTVRTAVLRTAAGIRYGQTVPIRFPYWISGLPAAWHISEVDYDLPDGRPVPQTLHLGDRPGATVGDPKADDLQVYVTATTDHSWTCPRGTGQHVTVAGVSAILIYSPQDQFVCVPAWHGLRVEVTLTNRQDAPAPDPAGPGGVLTYTRLLHSLGPSPASWTTRPLR